LEEDEAISTISLRYQLIKSLNLRGKAAERGKRSLTKSFAPKQSFIERENYQTLYKNMIEIWKKCI
jgi:hypothetical protein